MITVPFLIVAVLIAGVVGVVVGLLTLYLMNEIEVRGL